MMGRNVAKLVFWFSPSDSNSNSNSNSNSDSNLSKLVFFVPLVIVIVIVIVLVSETAAEKASLTVSIVHQSVLEFMLRPISVLRFWMSQGFTQS